MAGDIFQQFFSNLQLTQKLYARLLETAENKRSHILANNVEHLREDLQLEERLAGAATELDLQRQALHQRCCAELKVHATTLQALTDAMPPPWKEHFQRERNRLQQTMHKLHAVNRANVGLINNSLELVNGMLAAMFDAEPVAAYSRQGVRAAAELSHRALNASA